MSDLRLQSWSMPAANLGLENPLPPLFRKQLPPRLIYPPDTPDEMLENLVYGHLSSRLPYTVQDGYDRQLQPAEFRTAACSPDIEEYHTGIRYPANETMWDSSASLQCQSYKTVRLDSSSGAPDPDCLSVLLSNTLLSPLNKQKKNTVCSRSNNRKPLSVYLRDLTLRCLSSY